MTQYCNMCKEEISSSNVFTDAGRKELAISGICEVCFDNVTFDIEDELEALIEKFNVDIQPVLSVKGCFLAGGALRLTVDPEDEVQDIDLFFETKEALNEALNYYDNSGLYKSVFRCPKGELFTYRNLNTAMKVQLVAKEFYSPQEAIASFDIIAGCAAWDGERFYKNRKFISDVLNKRLSINTVTYPRSTMRRVAKYVDKGYRLTREAVDTFVDTVNAMELSDGNSEYYID